MKIFPRLSCLHCLERHWRDSSPSVEMRAFLRSPSLRRDELGLNSSSTGWPSKWCTMDSARYKLVIFEGLKWLHKYIHFFFFTFTVKKTFMGCMHKYFAHVPLQNCRSSFGPERTLSSHVPAGRKYWPELHSRKSTAVGFSKLGHGRVFSLSASIPIRLQTVQSNVYFYTE